MSDIYPPFVSAVFSRSRYLRVPKTKNNSEHETDSMYHHPTHRVYRNRNGTKGTGNSKYPGKSTHGRPATDRIRQHRIAGTGLRSSEEEGYTVFGKGTPIIYIDNRLLQGNTELERLSAADIEKVELITNPGAEYDATVKAVVRIRTVRGRNDGFGGNLRAGITQRRRTCLLYTSPSPRDRG